MPGKISQRCIVCEAEYFVYPGHVGKRKYCSRKCNSVHKTGVQISPRVIKNCPVCDTKFHVTVARTHRRLTCSKKCRYQYQRKVIRPSPEVLADEIKFTSLRALGRKYGVRDNTVRKWAKRYGLIDQYVLVTEETS